jgi:hypothetical protein
MRFKSTIALERAAQACKLSSLDHAHKIVARLLRTPDEDDRLVIEVGRGWTRLTPAERAALEPSAIATVKRPRGKLTDELKQTALDMRLKGVKTQLIAAAVGISDSALEGMFRAEGIVRKRAPNGSLSDAERLARKRAATKRTMAALRARNKAKSSAG